VPRWLDRKLPVLWAEHSPRGPGTLGLRGLSSAGQGQLMRLFQLMWLYQLMWKESP
jgi:hypothetical protein